MQRKSMTNYVPGVLLALLFLALAVTFNACQGGKTTVGNGTVDAVEAATIRVAVGLALSAKPEAVAPAYAVSTALLAIIDKDAGTTALADTIKDAITKETARLDLDPVTAASFGDLVALVEAEIRARLAAADISASARMVVIRDVIAIVQEAAAARLPLVGTKLAA